MFRRSSGFVPLGSRLRVLSASSLPEPAPHASSWHLGAIPLLLGLFLLATVTPSLAELPEREQIGDPFQLRDTDRETWVDANRIEMVTTNHGSFGYDIPRGNPGLLYPRGGTNSTLFAGGLWIGAQVWDDDLRLAVAEYSFEYIPGGIESDGSWDTGYGSNSRWRTYKIQPGDTPGSNPDYAEWPIQDGAPTDENGDPRHLGGQTLWSVYHDADPSRHQNGAGNTAPLGVEVQQTTYALDVPGIPSEIVFVEWKLINKGSEDWHDAYVSAWTDVDLGGASDDLVGCDPDRSLGFCYNATNSDNQYGSSPPAIGFQFVQGPIVPSPGDVAYVSGVEIPGYRNLPMTAFNKYTNGTDPTRPEHTYNYMRGLARDGGPVIDPLTGDVTTFVNYGDPVTQDGWLDSDPSDRRMMVSSGPFDLRVGESQTVAVAVVMGQGADRLDSITQLRRNADRTTQIFRGVYGDGGEGACCNSTGVCTITTSDLCEGAFFSGEDCLPSVCLEAIGACCYDNGTCVVLYERDCAGDFLGGGSNCFPGLCRVYAPPAACCFGDGTCETLGERDCLESGGEYLAGNWCGPSYIGDPPGWQRNRKDNPMIDEVIAGGVPVPPDGNGGPGNDVWHSYNSTVDWIVSAGGGDGGEGRFTRDGADEENLTEKDLELRWDLDPDNYGWWAFETDQAAQIPFGLYLVDPFTGEEERLIVILFSGGGTTGVYDISTQTVDGWQGWPATDWAYAYTGDYDAFLADATDGWIDDTSQGDFELFARMVFASQNLVTPTQGTVLRFVTTKPTVRFGNDYPGEVPLAWDMPNGEINCVDTPLFEVFRDGSLLDESTRTDYLDRNAVPGRTYSYSVRTRNTVTGETSELSAPIEATASAGGYSAPAGAASTPPTLDGIVSDGEWADATIVEAMRAPYDPPSHIRLMNDGDYLYVAIEDGATTTGHRIYMDSNGNGSYDRSALEGMLQIRGSGAKFIRGMGSYPNAKFTVSQIAGGWVQFAATDQVTELRISLSAGPLADRDDSGIVPMFFWSIDGAAAYPPGPQSVVREAPWLFSRIQLADVPGGALAESDGAEAGGDGSSGQGTEGEETSGLGGLHPSLPEVERSLGFPNPFVDTATIAFRVPSAQRVSATVFGVDGGVVRVLADGDVMDAGVHAVDWDGTDGSQRRVPPGVYFYEVRGETFHWTDRITMIR